MNLQLPPNNPFLFIPTKKQVTHGKGIAPQAHTCFSQHIPLPTCILSVPCPGKSHLLILRDGRSSQHGSRRLPPAPTSRQHTPAAPSSLPHYGAPTLTIQLAHLPNLPKTASQTGTELMDPSSSLSASLSVSVWRMVFMQAIVFSFLPGFCSNSSSASFNSEFPVSNRALSWESNS